MLLRTMIMIEFMLLMRGHTDIMLGIFRFC
jgi:hypothetical protein